MEKTLDIKHEERPVVKIGILASHIKFLMETDNLRFNIQKFGERIEIGEFSRFSTK